MLLMQFSSAATFPHDIYFKITTENNQKFFVIYPTVVSILYGEKMMTNICKNFCNPAETGIMKNCKCDPETVPLSQRRMILTFSDREDYRATSNALEWLRKNTDASLQPVGLLPLFRDIYNPLIERNYIQHIDTNDGDMTVTNTGHIKKGIFNIDSNINFPFEKFIDTNNKYGGATVSNAQIDFGEKKIFLNQKGELQSGTLPITCYTFELSRETDKIHVYNFEEATIEIPLDQGEIDDCSGNFFERIKTQYKFANTSLIDFLISGKASKPDAFCVKSSSNFLIYFDDCSSFSKDGQTFVYKKYIADMKPTSSSSFVLYYNAPIDHPLKNIMCASKEFDFKIGQANPTTQRCLGLVGEGKSVFVGALNEKTLDTKDLAYNQEGKTYYNFMNLFNIPEEDKLENLAGISENNPRITVIDSKNLNAINLIKSV